MSVETKWTWDSGKGRLDIDGVEWFACDPYPSWYRYDVDGLITPEKEPTWPN